MPIVKQMELLIKTGTSEKDIKNLNDGLQDLGKSVDEIPKATKKATKGFKGLGGAIAASGLGAFLIVAKKMIEVFKENQIVLDAFNTSFEVVSLAFNDLFNYLNNNVGTVIDYFKRIFSDPVQAISDFRKALVEGFIVRIREGVEALGLFGQAALKFFKRDFAGAAETAREAGKQLVDVVTGVDNTFEKVSETLPTVIDGIVNYAVSTAKAAQETVNLQKKAEIGIAQNRIILEQKDREAEKLRQIRDDESKTIDERIEANNKLAAVLEEQERLMLANADAVIAAAQAQFDKNANDENQIALLEAKAEREGILAQIEGFRSEQLMNINSLERERLDLIDEEKEKAKEAAEEQIALSRAVAEAKIQDSVNTLNSIVELAGEGSALGKAAAVTSATISGIEGVQNAYSTAQKSPITAFFPAYPIVQAGLAAAFSASQIKSIVSTPKPNKSGFSARSPRVGSGGGGGTSAAQAPAFNVVGASGTNQLAEAINGRDAQPVKAFVVSNEVTNAQALDRNIVNSASLG